jgi:hypothetical protein
VRRVPCPIASPRLGRGDLGIVPNRARRGEASGGPNSHEARHGWVWRGELRLQLARLASPRLVLISDRRRQASQPQADESPTAPPDQTNVAPVTPVPSTHASWSATASSPALTYERTPSFTPVNVASLNTMDIDGPESLEDSDKETLALDFGPMSLRSTRPLTPHGVSLTLIDSL